MPLWACFSFLPVMPQDTSQGPQHAKVYLSVSNKQYIVLPIVRPYSWSISSVYFHNNPTTQILLLSLYFRWRNSREVNGKCPGHTASKRDIFFQEQMVHAQGLSACYTTKHLQTSRFNMSLDKHRVLTATIMAMMAKTVQFSRSVVSDSLRPHGLQHTRLPCPSLTPGACSNSCALSRWCHPSIHLPSPTVIPFFSCLQSFPASISFLMSQFFTSGGQILKLQPQHQSFQWTFRTDFL